MNSDDLKPWQAEKIFFALEPFVGFLHRLRLRMEARKFSTKDALYRALLDVQRAVCTLQAALIDIILKDDKAMSPRERTTDELLANKPPDRRPDKNPPR